MPTPSSVADQSFDEYVAGLLRRSAGDQAALVQTVYDRWLADRPAGQTFLDHLTEREVIDRVRARSVLLAWQGGLDDRDARQMFDSTLIGQAFGRLLPTVEWTPPPVAEQTQATRAIGSRLGRYSVKGVLGWGGFGPVYLAVHPTLRVSVALKPIGRGSPAADRLRAEVRLQASINHAHVVRVWDYEDGTDPFLVLEYVPGENLRDRLATGPLDVRESFLLVVQTALALRAALRVGVTHHDVKPANILTTPENGFKLGDFGLARSRRPFQRAVAGQSKPAAPMAAGTWNYAAPEQFENCQDHRADVYSLGLTVYHALSGQVPVPGTDADAVMMKHKKGGLEAVHRLAPGVPPAVSDLIRRMTAVDPERRFNTYDDLIRAAETAFDLRLEPY